MISALLASTLSVFRTRAALQLEILSLRHQLAWQRSVKKLKLNRLGVATLERRPRRRGIAGAGPDRCGIANSDQNLLRGRWLEVARWPPPFAQSSACRNVPCGL